MVRADGRIERSRLARVMKRTVAGVGAAGAQVRALIDAAGAGTLAERMDRVSARLLGRPYVENPLGGGPGRPETLRVSLSGFDCVTYVETVLALARSRDSEEFLRTLRRIRYRGGRPAWSTRNHYMTGWARENAARGLVHDLTLGPETAVRERTLSMVPGIPARKARVRCFPKALLCRIGPRLATGDLVLFASTRRRLDVFHVGLLVRTGAGLRLRHAARSAGRVVEQPLAEFAAARRMAGLIVLRPVDSRSARPRLRPAAKATA